jgi:hypothetical protein
MADVRQYADIAQFERMLRELADRNEITDLVSRLGLWLDEKRFDEATSIFTEDVAAQTPGGTVQGIALVAEQARRNHATVERTQHIITNVLIDLDGDHATVQANLLVTFAYHADTPGPHFTLGERYRFEAIRTPQGWRLSRLRITPVWTSGTREGGAQTQAAS